MRAGRWAAAAAVAGFLALSGAPAAHAVGDGRNCSDFSSQIKIVNGYDPDNLDTDNDGVGCEMLPGPPVAMDLYSDLKGPADTTAPTLAATGLGSLISHHPVRTVGVAVILVGAGGALAYGARRKGDR